MLVSCFGISSTLKMEAIFSSETPVDFQRTTQRYIPGDRTLQFSLFVSFVALNDVYLSVILRIKCI
jgi:hypothetical protein